MKKATLLLLLSLLPFVFAAAQGNGTAPLEKGEKQLNFGTGISDHGLPIYSSLDFAIHDDVTIGPGIHLRIDDDDTRFGILFRGDYHFNYLIGIPENWDFYAGARVGIEFGDDVDGDLGIQVGGRWYWSEKWGINLEFAGGTGFGTTFGMSMKF